MGRAQSRVVEFVGAGGVGKTTVSRHIGSASGIPVLTVSETSNSRAKLTAVFHAIRLAGRHRLNFAETVSLWRKCSSVECGLRCVEAARHRVMILDEGPIRTLRDRRCSSFRERAAWWDYAKQALARLARLEVPVLVVELELDERVRLNRYRDRALNSGGADGRRLGGKISGLLDRLTHPRTEMLIPTIGRGVRIFMAARLAELVVQRRVRIGETDTPAEVAQRVVELMASPTHGDPAGAGARSTAGS